MGHPDAGVGITQPGGWLFNILPYIEESTLYKQQQGKTGTSLQEVRRSASRPLRWRPCIARAVGRCKHTLKGRHSTKTRQTGKALCQCLTV